MNAKEEFLSHLNDLKLEVLCASIRLRAIDSDVISEITTGYTNIEYDDFLKSIDIDYDQNTPKLHGTIWFKNNSHSERGLVIYNREVWKNSDIQNSIGKDIPIRLNRIDKVREQVINKILS